MSDDTSDRYAGSSCGAYASWAICCWHTFLMGGPILGYASLREMLVHEAVYSDLCDVDDREGVCEEQELALQAIFVGGYVATIGARLPLGIFLDTYGPRASSACGSLLTAGGGMLLAVSGEHFDGFVLGAVLIGMGGCGVHLANFHISNQFPDMHRTVIASFSGVFTMSAFVFTLFQQWNAAGASKGMIFTVYSGACLLAALVSWRVQPPDTLQRGQRLQVDLCTLQCVPTSMEPACGNSDSTNSSSSSSSRGGSGSGSSSGTAGTGLSSVLSWEQVTSREFAELCVFFATGLTCMGYYIGSVSAQLTRKDAAAAAEYATYFNTINSWLVLLVLYPAGRMLDKLGCWAGFTIAGLCFIVAFAVTVASDSLAVQLLPFAMVGLGRFILFASFFAYIPFQFGFATFGKIAGFCSFLSAAISMLQYALSALALAIGYSWVNGLCICMLVLVLAVPLCRMRPAHIASLEASKDSHTGILRCPEPTAADCKLPQGVASAVEGSRCSAQAAPALQIHVRDDLESAGCSGMRGSPDGGQASRQGRALCGCSSAYQ